ncbi:hypothetical protein RCL1_004004 [Eukaryota sp. TZLM3-RCL]
MHQPITLPRSFPLSDDESTLFQLLKDVTRHFRLPTVVRVAGGWVRDKLLHIPAKFDVDVTLSDMTGTSFAQKVNEFLIIHGESPHKIAVIESNPEKSKHLETARTRLYGFEVDFCNLRSETYSEHSRIPIVEFGSAEQDALRRDFTVNSMFYNLLTDSVEDFSGHGFTDLANKMIATPLDPLITFKDDPLRVLRALRFASRLDFTIQDAGIQQALQTIVSRERVGEELSQMFESTRVFSSIRHLVELRLLDVVFAHDLVPFRGDYNMQISILTRCYLCTQALKQLNISPTPLLNKILFVSAMLLECSFPTIKIKSKEVPLTTWLGLNSVKWPRSVAEAITTVCHSSRELQELAKSSEVPSRLELARVLRNAREYWPLALVLACSSTCCMIDVLPMNCYDLSNSDVSLDLPQSVLQCFLTFSGFKQLVSKYSLDNIWQLKPILTGIEVADLLGLKPGPDIRNALERCLELQFQFPDHDRDAIIEKLTVNVK